jgi:NADPH2:quinone reductase
MKALLSKVPGGPETLSLEELPSPKAGPGQVVVEVAACAVNFPDVLMIAGKYQTQPERPFIPGGEIAGVVKQVGEGVETLAPGDRVISAFFVGGMCEEAAVDAARVVRMPDSMSFKEGAALLIAYGTSHHALNHRARLKPGETLLVLGAAGGVGLGAVELGKAMGARVIAAASSQDKLDLCLAHGADAGVVYGRGPFDADARKALAKRFKDAVGADGADVVYDSVGGDYAEPALRAIAWEGRYLVVGFAAGDIPRIPLNLALLKGCDIQGVFWGEWMRRNPAGLQRETAELMALYEAGAMRPYVSETFPLERGAEAIARLADRRALGKVVVVMK